MIALKGLRYVLFSGIVVYLGLALGLLLSQWPTDLNSDKTLSFKSVVSNIDQPAIPLTHYTARDGTNLTVRHIKAQSDDAPLVIIIHGSGWHGGGYQEIAHYLTTHGDFEIVIPDLRGHGLNPKRRGDVDYIGQYEDDLADLISNYNQAKREVIMIGHSSGGGLIIRFAGGQYGKMLDKAVLMAPFLHHDAPTIRQDAGGWAHPLIRRIIGLSMLNSIGIDWFNGMTIMQFNFPESILQGTQGNTATQQYSYRLNTSFAPRTNYLGDIAKLPEFLMIIGTEDDAFHADKFESTMEAVNSRGKYVLVQGVDHLGIINDKEALEDILAFIQ